MSYGDFHLCSLLKQNARPFTAEISVENSYLKNCGLCLTKPEHFKQCKLWVDDSCSREIIGEFIKCVYTSLLTDEHMFVCFGFVIVIGVSGFYCGYIGNVVCGRRVSIVTNPIIQRKRIDLAPNDDIKPCIKIYHATRNIFWSLGVIMMNTLAYDDPKMTPSEIQNRLFTNHFSALMGKLGNGPYDHKNLEKLLKKILLFGNRANGTKNSYHYEKLSDNLFDSDFEDKFEEMRGIVFVKRTSNIAGDGTYRFGSNIVSPYFQFVNEDYNSSDDENSENENKNNDSKANAIKTFQSADFLKSKYKLKCRLLIFANHLNLVMDMCLSPDQSGEGESHKYLVAAYSRVLLDYLDTVDECYDFINFTTDGIEANKNIPIKTKQTCIENSDIDEEFFDNLTINVC